MKKLFYFAIIALVFSACGKQDQWNFTGKVETTNGEFILGEKGAEAASTNAYKNFILEFECKTDSGAVGALSFHTGTETEVVKGYEVLINNNSDPSEWRKSGSLSTVRNFAKCVAGNNTWAPFKIIVADRNIRVYVDSLFIVDYTEPDEPFRLPEYAERKLAEGLLRFSSCTDQAIAFRNIRIQKLDNELINREDAPDEQNDDIIRLSQQNFPTIDAHLHLKGGLTAGDVETLTRKYGITYGIAPNCGKNFPITDDQGIYNWLDSVKHHLFLLPMQAEGREWLEMFSPEAVRKFDYVFTDAMTWTDNKGRRMRIWIPEETFVDNKQQFMDLLVERACGIISSEPINIYVNPTFIPEELQPEYETLWTDKRMSQVIEACVNNGVAIEINCRYRIPSERFIKMAKAAGAKFTIGTNNAGIDDVGKIEYAVEMIKACDLKASDMWIPVSRNN
ncbi:hypothetical protein FACS189451_04870 [Bacteroidia bacterium]|nr:hypothetical protein FACS189451_04870 [Bacteroidia bacterium]